MGKLWDPNSSINVYMHVYIIKLKEMQICVCASIIGGIHVRDSQNQTNIGHNRSYIYSINNSKNGQELETVAKS